MALQVTEVGVEIMNNALQDFARNSIKEGLYQCLDRQVRIFKLMYARTNPDAPADLDMEIDDVVDLIPSEALDWAMQQVERTLEKNAQRIETRVVRREDVDDGF
jgi:hypothetical protein